MGMYARTCTCVRVRIVCMYACMHVCIYAYIHVCMCAYMHGCAYACMRVCMYACMYVCIHAYMHTCKYACMHTCMHAYTHAHIHTYIHFSANSEHIESFRSVDRTSLILAHWHSALRLASAPQSENSARPARAVHPLPQPSIFFKLHGEGAITTNSARGQHATLPRYDTATQPTRYDKCVGPGVPPSTPQGSKTSIISRLHRQQCLQPLDLAEPRV